MRHIDIILAAFSSHEAVSHAREYARVNKLRIVTDPVAVVQHIRGEERRSPMFYRVMMDVEPLTD